jgi:hypothetical protein
MRLELENGEILSEPSPEALEAALRRLDGEENTFAILDSERGDNNYLQAAGGPERFVVEYRETGRHFSCEDVLFETVAALFESYRRRGPRAHSPI